jgi:RNA polymerase sigma-54 factor
MPKLSPYLSVKAKLKVTSHLIKKMEIFSKPYIKKNKFSSTEDFLKNTASASTNSLDTFLLDQIDSLIVSDKDKLILEKMVELLDDNGLFSNWSEVQEILQLEFSISKRQTYNILSCFQDLEPEGVGATSIKNFLEIQIKRYELEDEEFRNNLLKVISYEHDLYNQNWYNISNNMSLPVEDIKLLLLFIKNNLVYTLPRKQYTQVDRNPISPSAEVTLENGTFSINILEKYEHIYDKELLQIFEERTKCLETLLLVFFQKQSVDNYKATNLLKPITQKLVAESTGYSNSMVSRLVNSKYILFNNRMMLLKSLFQRKVNNSNFSSIFIKKFIQENSDLTDQVITEKLKTLGLIISRRNVNYYRNKFFKRKTNNII